MFVSDKAFELFQISKDTVDALRTDLATIRAELLLTKDQLSKSQITSDWLRMKVNQLEYQNAALLEKAYNVKLPVPEIARRQVPDPATDEKNFSFDDLGDEVARKFGMPVYTDK